MNINALRTIALITAFISGAFAHSFYYKAPLNMVKMEVTKSGKFVLTDGHIYELNELEMVVKQPDMVFPTYNEGASQSYRLPTGKK